MKKLSLLIVPLMMASCSTASSSSEIITSSVDDVYEAISTLKSTKNYTLSTLYSEDNYTREYDNIYTEKYVYCNLSDDKEGYIQSQDGIYRVNEYNGELISSELFVDDNNNPFFDLWESKVFPSFHDFDLSLLENAKGQTVYKVNSKMIRLSYLNILEVDQKYLTSIDSFTISLGSNDINSLSFDIIFNNGTFFSSKISSFNKSSSIEIESFLAKGGEHATIDSSLLEMKRCFALNNYRRVCYEDDNPSSRVIGYEWFLPDYFYGDYIVPEYVIYEAGYISLPRKQYNDVRYDGAYLFYLNDEYKISSFYGQQPAFVSSISDMPTIMNYPSKMKMFDYNLQFFDKIDDPNYPGRDVFVTTDLYLINDWINNFQINLSDLPTARIYDLRVIAETYTSTPEENTFIFQFDYVYDGVVYGLQREFIGFGTSNIADVDNFLSSFTDY